MTSNRTHGTREYVDVDASAHMCIYARMRPYRSVRKCVAGHRKFQPNIAHIQDAAMLYARFGEGFSQGCFQSRAAASTRLVRLSNKLYSPHRVELLAMLPRIAQISRRRCRAVTLYTHTQHNVIDSYYSIIPKYSRACRAYIAKSFARARSRDIWTPPLRTQNNPTMRHKCALANAARLFRFILKQIEAVKRSAPPRGPMPL